ncbi:hypothetical protein EXIGLDRAFT_199167 [Exidia glandulosa HHB12029]|uniref:Uncharacterized protein n=1 Tax=Exidia glandulosa HHB12029 TaxID=1314781 RepID=A0A165MY45_EXIGL|nr:hypothetical protein EXIGLDRAFT_199167 [Exidia glandulosa HHB12029]
MSGDRSGSESETWSERSASPPYDPAETNRYALFTPGERRTASLGTNITDEIFDVSERPVSYGGSADVYQGTWDSHYGPMKVCSALSNSSHSVFSFPSRSPSRFYAPSTRRTGGHLSTSGARYLCGGNSFTRTST